MDRTAKIETKKAQVRKLYDEISKLSNAAKSKDKQLKTEKEAHTQSRLTRTRQTMHKTGTVNDRVLRPSDRSNDIRTYSKMDLDVWKYEDVREWFNHYAQDVPENYLSPAEQGYMIKKDS
mmetsp:Transcript_10110/g.15324  ORF Transcript_10110/g.15324 Transcript_10110/m.15324 type:complete len:120 (-) Transcript_10110:144-503(-)